jgi:hypothetical protein
MLQAEYDPEGAEAEKALREKLVPLYASINPSKYSDGDAVTNALTR